MKGEIEMSKKTDYPICPHCGFEDKKFKEECWDDEWIQWSGE
jgi:hypothetical protein